MHYRVGDGTFKDIDTNLKLDRSGAYYVIDSGLYNVAFAAAIGRGDWDVAYEVPRPVKEKFREPSKARPPVTRIRWKVLSYGYWEAQENRYLILEHAQSVPPVVSGRSEAEIPLQRGNTIRYPQIFNNVDLRYICGIVGVKEEVVLSQFGRDNLPDPADYSLSRENTYFVVAIEFLLTPANINVFARRQTGKSPIRQGSSFSFDGDEPIDFEDADSTLHFFFAKDYAYATADSVTDFSNRISLRRYFYSDRGKDYMLVGVPWAWIDSAPEGDLIIDPTTKAATSADVRLFDENNYGSDTRLAIGKFPNANNYKARTLIPGLPRALAGQVSLI